MNGEALLIGNLGAIEEQLIIWCFFEKVLALLHSSSGYSACLVNKVSFRFKIVENFVSTPVASMGENF